MGTDALLHWRTDIMTLDKKYNNLLDSLKKMERVVIAFSGGVDSTFLLKAATLSGLGKIQIGRASCRERV